MEIRLKDKNIVEINDARIVFRNFSGRADKYNREGDRNFAVVFPDLDIADVLINDTNEFGVGWNVKVKEPREDGDAPFIYLPVKIKFNNRGPAIYLKTGDNLNRLDEESVCCLDDVDIISVDLDIRPYDDVINGKPFRAAYLQSMCVTQNVDRFAARYSRAE